MGFESLPIDPGRGGQLARFRERSRGPIRVHRHLELEFNLVVAGKGRYLVDNRRVELSPWTLIWLYPDQDHLLLETSDDFDMWIAVFSRGLLKWACRTPWSRELRGRSPRGLFCKQLRRDRGSELSHRLEAVHGVVDQADRFRAGLAEALLVAWHEHEHALRVEDADVHPAVERAARLIRDRADDPGLEALAQEAGLSPSHLSRLFKRQLGMSLASFRQRQRLERFFECYGQGGRHNLTEAAYAAGFGSYAQFHRVFKRHVGISPAAYRRNLEAPATYPPQER